MQSYHVYGKGQQNIFIFLNYQFNIISKLMVGKCKNNSRCTTAECREKENEGKF